MRKARKIRQPSATGDLFDIALWSEATGKYERFLSKYWNLEYRFFFLPIYTPKLRKSLNIQ
jgi:hypothetical protein